MNPFGAASFEEDLLVDLLNTLPVVDDAIIDILDDAWALKHGGNTSDLSRLATLRAELQAAVRREPDRGRLNERLKALATFPSLQADGTVAWLWARDPAESLEHRVLLSWVSVMTSRPDRLRPCGNDECNLFLLDRSRSGTAKWCSMATCGNRLKARRFNARS